MGPAGAHPLGIPECHGFIDAVFSKRQRIRIGKSVHPVSLLDQLFAEGTCRIGSDQRMHGNSSHIIVLHKTVQTCENMIRLNIAARHDCTGREHVDDIGFFLTDPEFPACGRLRFRFCFKPA